MGLLAEGTRRDAPDGVVYQVPVMIIHRIYWLYQVPVHGEGVDIGCIACARYLW